MKKGLIFAAALTLLSVPAFAQYGGGAQNSGGPLVSSRGSTGPSGAMTAPTRGKKATKHKRHSRKAMRRHSGM